MLIVASLGWFEAYDKKAPPGSSGLGAATEADIFRQDLWDRKGNNARIRLAFLHDVPQDSVPALLRAWHQFRPFEADDQLNQLARWIGDCLGILDVHPPTVTWPPSVPFEPDLADRSKLEWPAIVDLLAGRSRERILLYEGGTGVGKSVLIRQAMEYAQRLGIPVVYLDFKGDPIDVNGILDQFDLDLDAKYLPGFVQQGGDNTKALRKDLRALKRPVLAVFDSYEHVAENESVASWLSRQLLVEAERALGLAIIVMGQRVPEFANARWGDLARYIPVGPINGIDHWEAWVERRFPGFDKEQHLPTILALTDGNPANVSTYCKTIAEKG